MNNNIQVEIIEKGKITIIGKMGQGTTSSDVNWIQELWDEANEHFNELGSLVKVEEDGTFAGFWVVLSDIDNNFLPWDWQGKYLAGCEVKEDSEAPEGWTKWVLPAFKYLSVKCNHNNYDDAVSYMNNIYIPKHKYKIIGAMQEYYDQKSVDGSFNLLFPIDISTL